VRQRSTHEAPVDIPEIPATVGPGEEVDWPTPIAGFEPVLDEPAPEPDEPAKTTRKKPAPAPAPTGEEPTL
jgi:hypothetical protein